GNGAGGSEQVRGRRTFGVTGREPFGGPVAGGGQSGRWLRDGAEGARGIDRRFRTPVAVEPSSDVSDNPGGGATSDLRGRWIDRVYGKPCRTAPLPRCGGLRDLEGGGARFCRPARRRVQTGRDSGQRGSAEHDRHSCEPGGD